MTTTTTTLDIDGRPLPIRDHTVAILGSRAATSYGLHVAGEMALDLSERGWAVVNCGAFGVEGAALRGALVGPSSHPVLVPPAGLAAGAYPRAHRALFDRVRDQGTLASPFPADEPPQRANFKTARDVLLDLASVIIVVEASATSGVLSVARKAMLRGPSADRMTVFAVPGPVTSSLSYGPHQLLREGAHLCTQASDVGHITG